MKNVFFTVFPGVSGYCGDCGDRQLLALDTNAGNEYSLLLDSLWVYQYFT